MISVVFLQLKVKGDMAISEGCGPTMISWLVQIPRIKTKVEGEKKRAGMKNDTILSPVMV